MQLAAADPGGDQKLAIAVANKRELVKIALDLELHIVGTASQKRRIHPWSCAGGHGDGHVAHQLTRIRAREFARDVGNAGSARTSGTGRRTLISAGECAFKIGIGEGDVAQLDL